MADLRLQLLINAVDRASPSLKRIGRAVDQVSRRTGLDRVGRRLRNVGRGLRDVGAEASKFAARLGVGLVAGAGGLFALTGRFAAAGDNIAKTADKLGLGVVELQRFRYSARLAGLPVQTFDMAMQRFTRRAAEAAAGTGEAKDALRFLGIQLRDSGGKIRPSGQLLGEVADAMARIEDPALRLRVAFKLFDSEGVAMVNMLKGGSGAMKTQGDEAERLGVITEDQARAAERYVDASTKMKRSLEFLSHEIGIALLPDMRALIDRMTEFFRTVRPEATEEFRLAVKNLGAIAAAAADAFDWLVASGGKLLDWLEETFPAIKRWREAADGWLKDIGWLTAGLVVLSAWFGRGLIFAIAKAMIAVIAFGATLLTTPVGWVILGLAALVGAGWWLYRNWDKVVALSKRLWGGYQDWWKRNVSDGLGVPEVRTGDVKTAWQDYRAWWRRSWLGFEAWWAANDLPEMPTLTTGDVKTAWQDYRAWWRRSWLGFKAWWAANNDMPEMPTLTTGDAKTAWQDFRAWWRRSWLGFEAWWAANSDMPEMPAFTTGDVKTAWQAFRAWWRTSWADLETWWVGVNAQGPQMRGLSWGDFAAGWRGFSSWWRTSWAGLETWWAGLNSPEAPAVTLSGATAAWRRFTGWFEAAFSEWDAGLDLKSLFDVGVRWIDSLWDGIEARWQQLTAWIDRVVAFDWFGDDDGGAAASERSRRPHRPPAPLGGLGAAVPSAFALGGALAAQPVAVGGEVLITVNGMRRGDRVDGVRSDNRDVPLRVDAGVAMVP